MHNKTEIATPFLYLLDPSTCNQSFSTTRNFLANRLNTIWPEHEIVHMIQFEGITPFYPYTISKIDGSPDIREPLTHSRQAKLVRGSTTKSPVPKFFLESQQKNIVLFTSCHLPVFASN